MSQQDLSAPGVADPSSAAMTALPERSRGWTRAARLIALALIALAFLHNLWMGWNHFGDPVVDCGRELDVPRQLLSGKMLYRQVRYWYGPLAPYTNALLYGTFGVHSGVVACAGWCVAALVSWVSYRTARLFTGRGGAVVGTICILYMNAFAFYYRHDIFNFVLPYSCAATYGTLLAMASVYCLMRFVRRRRRLDYLFACGLLALTVLCKLEMAFAALLTHIVFIANALATRRLEVRLCLVGYALVVAVPAAVYGYFYARTGPALLSDNLLLATNLASNALTVSSTGLANISQFASDAWRSAHRVLACLAVLWVVARADARLRQRLALGWRRYVCSGFVVAVGGLLCVSTYAQLGPFLSLRAVPPLLLVLLIWCFARLLRRSEQRTVALNGMLLAVFALALLGRIILRCGVDYYGFCLCLPAVLVLGVFWSRIAPSVVCPRMSAPSGAAAACGCILMAGVAWTHVEWTRQTVRETYGQPEAKPIRTASGIMPCSIKYAGSVDLAVDFLSALPPRSTVVVVPEGSGITFLAGCVNPLGMHTFLPLDLAGDNDEDALIARFEKAAPDVIVQTSRDVREYGKQGFGVDYALKLRAWIERHYQQVRCFQTIYYRVEIWARSG